MTINESDFQYIARAVANYERGRSRIIDTIATITDHKRNSKRHTVDSLMCGSIAKWHAEDAMFEELIVQVLVAIEIVTGHKAEEKYRMIAHAESNARQVAINKFEQKQKTEKEK